MVDRTECSICCLLPSPMMIEVSGADAAKVFNNLTTNDVAKLPEFHAFESFITDVRGWTVAHGFILKLPGRVLLLGQHPDSDAVCKHIDRYIVREDAAVKNLQSSHELLLTDAASYGTDVAVSADRADGISLPAAIVSATSRLSLTTKIDAQELVRADEALTSAERVELLRIRNFWPLMGQDIGDKCIPQELDRDGRAISFTKGCYLGQETIARLDARGQLQKKLCLVRVEELYVRQGTVLSREEKEVGTITSSAFDANERATYALAFLRRGNFEAGTVLSCENAVATVIAPPAPSR